MRRIAIFALLVIMCLTSCSDEPVDIIPPTIEELGYVPVPSEGEICSSIEPVVFKLEGGGELSFDLVFRDDTALSQYKVDIHNNFDCHGHGGGNAPGISAPNLENLTTDWTVLDIQDLSDLSTPISRTLNVPQNVTAGNYHFHIQVIDESGNDSPFTNFYSLKITNPIDSIAPEINVDEPSANSFTVKKGDLVNFKGQVTDNRSLSDGGNGIVYLSYTKLSTGNTFNTNENLSFDVSIDKSANFDFAFEIPQTLTLGNYRFAIGANDGVRNVAPFIFFDVELTN